jgi:hypothetical protein
MLGTLCANKDPFFVRRFAAHLINPENGFIWKPYKQ